MFRVQNAGGLGSAEFILGYGGIRLTCAESEEIRTNYLCLHALVLRSKLMHWRGAHSKPLPLAQPRERGFLKMQRTSRDRLFTYYDGVDPMFDGVWVSDVGQARGRGGWTAL